MRVLAPSTIRTCQALHSRPLVTLLDTRWKTIPTPLRATCRRSHLRAYWSVRASSGVEASLAELQDRLDEAVARENYQAAAELRDKIMRKRGDNKLAVEEANCRFYAAFQRCNIQAMEEVWGEGEHVQCVHPVSLCVAGRENVMESWRLMLGNTDGFMRFKLEDVRVFAGDTEAFVTCVEVIDAADTRGRVVATNVFEKQHGQWKIIHHHGSPAPLFV